MEKLKTLKRRKRYLAHRVSESDKDLSYDKAELSALTWAIDFIEKQRPDGWRDPEK